MSNDDVKFAPPHLGLASVATDVDSRIENLATAYASDDSPEAQTAPWLIRSLQIARRALRRLRAGEGGAGPDAQVIADQGLAVAPE